MMRWMLAAVAAGLVVGCGSPDADNNAPGTVVFTFSVTDGVRASPSFEDAFTGTVHGNIFLSREVSVTGPKDGAEQFGSVDVTGVDLETVQESVASWESDLLPPDDYTFLGFFDVDSNAGTSLSPDSGDPVTLPTTNQFAVVPGTATDVVIKFDLVL